jgi:hypothetical protein
VGRRGGGVGETDLREMFEEAADGRDADGNALMGLEAFQVLNNTPCATPHALLWCMSVVSCISVINGVWAPHMKP